MMRIVLSMMANDANFLLRSWNPAAAGKISCLASNDLFFVMQPLAVVISCLAAGLCFSGASATTSRDSGCGLARQIWATCGALYVAACAAVLAMKPVAANGVVR